MVSVPVAVAEPLAAVAAAAVAARTGVGAAVVDPGPAAVLAMMVVVAMN